MLILSEENERLKGTKYTLPKEIYKIFVDIVSNNQPSKDIAYVKAKNVIKNNGVVTMEWLKNMKHFFTKHKDESDIEFNRIGGYPVKTWVNYKLDQLTASYGRKEKKINITKPRKETSALAGMRGDHQSKSLNMVNSLLSDAIPKFESKTYNKTFIITEAQLDTIKEIYNNNNNQK